jgi:hypothetical protein
MTPPPPRGELPPGTVARARERESRTFKDRGGVWWRVYELPAHETSDARWEQCLIFESAETVRRVRDYPANWRDLSAAELEGLSWRT